MTPVIEFEAGLLERWQPVGPFVMLADPAAHTPEMQARWLSRWPPALCWPGLPAADSGSWQGVLVASGTTAPVVAKLNAEINAILKDPEVVARIAAQGAKPVPMTPQALATWMQASSVNFGKVIRENNLKIE